MLENDWFAIGINALLVPFTIYLFLLYFSLFFKKREQGNRRVIIGCIILAIWQLCIPCITGTFPKIENIAITMVFTLAISIYIFDGSFGKKCFFCGCF